LPITGSRYGTPKGIGSSDAWSFMYGLGTHMSVTDKGTLAHPRDVMHDHWFMIGVVSYDSSFQ
jgi:hypothetical protein